MPDTDTIDLDSSERKVWRTSQDDFSNTVVRPNGASVRVIIDSGGRWENLGFERGVNQDNVTVGNVFHIDVPAGETFTLDGFTMGGSKPGGARDPNGNHACFFVSPSHAGDVVFEDGFVREWYQPFYCSNSGNPPGNEPQRAPGRGGDVRIENVCCERFAHTAFRIGTPGSIIKDCVARNTYDRATRRAAWIYQTGGQIQGLHFDDSTTGIHIGSLYDRDPDPRIDDCYGPDRIHGDYHGSGVVGASDTSTRAGMPTSAEAAAGGSDGDDDGDGSDSGDSDGADGWRRIVVDASGSGGRVEYTVDASASEVRALDLADDSDTINERIITGRAAGGVDEFEALSKHYPHINSAVVRGAPSVLDAVTITVDGEPYDFEREETTPREHTLSIDGRNAGQARYWIILSADAVAHDRGPASINEGQDRAVQVGSHYAVAGQVIGGVDGWDSDGELVGAVTDGPGADDVDVRFDGAPAGGD